MTEDEFNADAEERASIQAEEELEPDLAVQKDD